jgi:hypothetical protein
MKSDTAIGFRSFLCDTMLSPFPFSWPAFSAPAVTHPARRANPADPVKQVHLARLDLKENRVAPDRQARREVRGARASPASLGPLDLPLRGNP